jgi:hypothetical protein
MKTLRLSILFLFGFLFCFAQGGLSRPPEVSVISYDVNAAIHTLDSAVDVSLVCELQKSDTVSHIKFLFNPIARVQSIQYHTKGGWRDITFEFAGTETLRLQLPFEARRIESLRIKFVYGFPITPQGDTLLILDRGNRWYPLIVDQIANFRLTVEMPRRYTAVSAGNLLESETLGDRSRSVWQSAQPVFKLPLIVFRSDVFTITSGECAGKTILLYSYRNDTLKAAQILAEAKNVFTFFTNYIGEYPHSRLALIEVPGFDGINIGSGVLTVGSSSVDQMKRGNYDALYLTIAQQWIGAGVFAKFGEPGFWFLSLSVPHYLRLMYVRQTKGEEAFDEAMQRPLVKYREFAGKDNDIPIIAVDFPNSKEKGLVLYAKGPFVISKIHKQMGEQRWGSFSRDLYNNFRGRILAYDEFQDCISKHDTNGGTLALLNRLMTQKGMPEE